MYATTKVDTRLVIGAWIWPTVSIKSLESLETLERHNSMIQTQTHVYILTIQSE